MQKLHIKNRKFLILLCGFFLCLLDFEFVYATPSTTYWTPCAADVQKYKKWHLTYDNYTTVGRNSPANRKQGGDLPADYGLTYGFMGFEKLQGEIGIDVIEPTDNPVSFNGKLGVPEHSLFKESPALNIGIFNAGTKKNFTNYNILHFIGGKTLPFNLGRFHASYYIGNKKVLKDALGKKENDGWMAGYDRFIYKDKVMFAADYASGKNAIGGGGFGLYYFFTPDISLLTGPVWFNDRALNGRTKWTLQLDINF